MERVVLTGFRGVFDGQVVRAGINERLFDRLYNQAVPMKTNSQDEAASPYFEPRFFEKLSEALNLKDTDFVGVHLPQGYARKTHEIFASYFDPKAWAWEDDKADLPEYKVTSSDMIKEWENEVMNTNLIKLILDVRDDDGISSTVTIGSMYRNALALVIRQEIIAENANESAVMAAAKKAARESARTGRPVEVQLPEGAVHAPGGAPADTKEVAASIPAPA